MNLTIDKEDRLNDSGTFVAPRAILEMYQRMSFRAFKVWACILTDIAEKDFSFDEQVMPISYIWNALDCRLSHERLTTLLDELQTTLIKKDEFLTQESVRKISSFSLLGPTEIEINTHSDVTKLKYQLVKGLVQLLRSESNKVLFFIEMRTFISLKGRAGQHAKNIVLLCTPHINTNETPFIEIAQLKEFMDLTNSYNNADGSVNYKTFNRDVLKPAMKAIEENPYVNFEIIGVKAIRENKKITQIKFLLKESRTIQNLLTNAHNDDSSPSDPYALKGLLTTYWSSKLKNKNLSYKFSVLERLLRQFKLVDKYIYAAINEAQYNKDPIKETERIFTITTAITQLWIDGHLSKEGSKIYSYANKILQNPSPSKVSALCNKFLIANNFINTKDEESKRIKKAQDESRAAAAKSLILGLKSYTRHHRQEAMVALDRETMAEFNIRFIAKAKKNAFGPWAKKAIIKCESGEDLNNLEESLEPVLTRMTLALYRQWLTEQCYEINLIKRKSIDDLLNKDHKLKLCVAKLNVSTSVSIEEFESSLHQFIK
ncbi:replication initiation protein [Pseudoalteromonas nigrifaciens]|uniref:replication initiation protein n=1 Tax=Pseudoalteromonas nigrifaciens TaxID=28109 RepID=UPI0017888612|nr:replication initiation protein [Pseudoalteromonas nigrifaciens]MBE0420176.1 replication initiation protein [Pseudoalteromonas nigrifaciens]